MTHRLWLDSLPIRLRLVYDRGYGKRYFRGGGTAACRQAGRNAVEQYITNKMRATHA